ncbi:hypothetical protein DNTS_015098, partial [Danionella cerebrum]
HFCSSGAKESAPVSQIYGDICPAGYYCPKQSSAPLPCPVGFILQDKGATSLSDCAPCPPSRYCIAPGSTQPSGFCSPGHYCVGGAHSSTPLALHSQRSCFCDLIPSSQIQNFAWCMLKHNTSCSNRVEEDNARIRTNQETRSLSTSGGYLETPREIMETCSGFKGDVCPT